ncbi:MAG TPA: choice-of-anchor Q domain-containing protein, partial [Xanthomonadales bacterium]|nr:choice-of-anchor Q domain-containing protein [Xanthomonadales bacterium]
TLADCRVTQNEGGLGGGVLGYASLVAIDECTITGNVGIVGGAVGLLESAALVTNATITGNAAAGFPDRPFESDRPELSALALPSGNALLAPNGIGLPPGTGGGIAAVADVAPPPVPRSVVRPAGVPLQVVVSDSDVSGNTAAVIGGGVVFYGVPALVENTTISGNTALRAGGIAAGSAPLVVAQATISGNSATGDGKVPGGGNFVVFGANASAPLQIASSTITGNTAAVRNGGIELYGDVPLTMSSTIVANSTGLDPADIVIENAPGAPVVTQSLVENPGDSGIGASGGNLIGVDPQLGPLADNGGPAPTHVPGAGSPVIDAGGNPTGAQFDQRGAPFARVVGAGPDIGSIERGNGASPSFVANVPATGTFGTLLLAAAMAAVAWIRRPRRARRTR